MHLGHFIENFQRQKELQICKLSSKEMELFGVSDRNTVMNLRLECLNYGSNPQSTLERITKRKEKHFHFSVRDLVTFSKKSIYIGPVNLCAIFPVKTFYATPAISVASEFPKWTTKVI